ncbi:hypothetical protein [Mycobacterium sp. E3247]|uniref:hypothetical protein n=1 Tax=Mycobacterium sp. E3247 TaxID=1856864 RepID=UPI0007FDD269|nr:hypothetical protein [Mycobacterium sp. E3247]OBH21065.1 hypothetical protein A9X04_01060 [Mycobacterium sp. E3247]
MQVVRVDTAALQAMATRWAASAGELQASTAPTVSGLSCQASASAVNVAHADVTAFTAALANRVHAQATRVTEAGGCYVLNEADSADEMAAVVHSTIGL